MDERTKFDEPVQEIATHKKNIHIICLLNHFFLNQNAACTSEIRIGTSTKGPMTVAKEAPCVIPKVAMDTAIANSKLFDAAVKDKLVVSW